MSLDLSLYLVANRGERSEENFLKILEEAILGGVKIIQLREKNLSSREFFELGKKVKKLCETFHIPLIINDRVDLALALDAAGVHLGQEDLGVSEARKILGPKKIIGLSVKSPEQIEAEADYFGCGALRPTPTKKSELMSQEMLKKICEKSPRPVVAIGGIEVEILRELAGIKISGIAVVRAIMDAPDPRAAARDLKAGFENLFTRG